MTKTSKSSIASIKEKIRETITAYYQGSSKMTKNFQDDDREEAMITLFDLYKDQTEGRSGVDAFLKLDGKTVPFELKTTSQGSVTTVRDFGPDHILKWKNKHWLIGFFIKGREYYKYGSPSMMEKWIKSKEEGAIFTTTRFKKRLQPGKDARNSKRPGKISD
ncbi:Uncharacterized protein dnl_22960 [Desulfonema limicola]|uniref:Uncharacterized protein n=1 Tax=Desulfonema limicola TaxID=45656 RepID=A0A975GG73_9BACT|nr:hypothetical protein [Desulfonema limicola]QTA80010.1 Uncharacterized protein dnl_22960 [Desulfonema limicola]